MRKFMRKNKALALCLAATLAVTMSGCGNSNGNTTPTTTNSSTETTSGSSTAQTDANTNQADTSTVSYPLQTDTALTYWGELNSGVASNYTNFGDTVVGKTWQEKTGVSVTFQHPAIGQVAEQFNLLMSDKTLPDLIEYAWTSYPGGPQKAIDDGVVIPLNDIIDKYCPNLKAYLTANPEIDKMVKTDDGTYYCFPFIRGGDQLLTNTGVMIRQDWLTELNLEMPKTIDDWHTVLTAFKEQKGAAAPFTYQYTSVSLTDNNPFAYAYGAPRGFYLADDGTIHFGAVEEGHKQYLQTMNQWMQEGLLDIDLATLTGDQVSAKITNGSAGASFGWAGSNMGTWTESGRATNPDYSLWPAPYPTVEAGAKPEFGRRENNYPGAGSVVITTSCKDVETAARFLDYAYGEEGHMLMNFGIEGESYTMTNGEPIYTDLILKNPDGLSISGAMSGYCRASYSGPFVQDERYVSQYYSLDSQKAALTVWSDTNAKEHTIPPITATVDESKELSQIMNEIGTYRDEMCLKFILGTKSFDEWDDYVNTINNMNLSRALEIQNNALERYNNR